MRAACASSFAQRGRLMRPAGRSTSRPAHRTRAPLGGRARFPLALGRRPLHYRRRLGRSAVRLVRRSRVPRLPLRGLRCSPRPAQKKRGSRFLRPYLNKGGRGSAPSFGLPPVIQNSRHFIEFAPFQLGTAGAVPYLSRITTPTPSPRLIIVVNLKSRRASVFGAYKMECFVQLSARRTISRASEDSPP